MKHSTRRTLQAYIFALAAVALAALTARESMALYKPLRQHGGFAFYLAAVAIVAWRSGFGPAFFATGLSALVASWQFLPPEKSFRVDSVDDAIRLLMFVFIAVLISSLHAAHAKVQRSLQESEQRLGFALESSGVGCWDADIKSGAFWKSPNLPAVFGRSPTDFATTYEGFFAYIHPEDRDFFRLATIRADGKTGEYEINHRIICGDGTVRRVSTRGRIYLNQQGRMERMVGAVYRAERTVAGGGGGKMSATTHLMHRLAGIQV
jgi:PAS domain-containing protein